jgi:hypothetical protein
VTSMIIVEVNVYALAHKTWVRLPHVNVELWHDGPGYLTVETRRRRVVG